MFGEATSAFGNEDANVSLTIKAGNQTIEGVATPPSSDMIKIEAGETIQIRWSANMSYVPNFGYNDDYSNVDAGSCWRIPSGVFQQNFWVIDGVAGGYSQYGDLASRPDGNVLVTIAQPGYYSFGIQCSYMAYNNATKSRKMNSDVKTVTIAVSAQNTNGCVPTNTCWKSICQPQKCEECGQKYYGAQCPGDVPLAPVHLCSCRAACLPGEAVNASAPFTCTVGGLNQKCCLSGATFGSGGSGSTPKPPTTDPTIITSFTTDIATLTAPGPITLSWVTLNATTCTASGGWSGSPTPLLSGSSPHSVQRTTTFYLECWNAKGLSSGERSVTVTMNNGSCTPNDTCAQNLCAGITCSDGCGGYINGQKNCAQADCVNPNNDCSLNTCTYNTCFNTCGTEIQGQKQCDALPVATTCTTGTCKGSCDLSKEKKVGVCNNNSGSCCEVIPPSTTIQSTTPFSNPVAFNTVEGLLDSLLGFLQASIVILSLIMIVIGSLIYMTAGGEDSKLSTGKYIITASLVGLALALAAPTFLKEVGNILGWNGVNNAAAQGKTLLEILTNVLNFLLSVIGIIGIIMLIIGGLMYLTSAGDEERMNQGKSIVVYSLIGITVALSALVLVTQVVSLFV